MAPPLPARAEHAVKLDAAADTIPRLKMQPPFKPAAQELNALRDTETATAPPWATDAFEYTQPPCVARAVWCDSAGSMLRGSATPTTYCCCPRRRGVLQGMARLREGSS